MPRWQPLVIAAPRVARRKQKPLLARIRCDASFDAVAHSIMDAEDRFAGQVHEFRHEGRLIYAWHQSVTSVYVEVPAPELRAKDVVCQFSSRTLVLGLRGNTPYVQVRVCVADFAPAASLARRLALLTCPLPP